MCMSAPRSGLPTSSLLLLLLPLACGDAGTGGATEGGTGELETTDASATTSGGSTSAGPTSGAASSSSDASGEATTDDATTDDPSATTTTTDGATDTDATTGEPLDPPEPPAYWTWLKIEIPGTVCGNGSQYKFWVNWSDTSDNVALFFEPGGACWDYPGCNGETPLGAANPDGLGDDHIDLWSLHSPLIRRDDPGNPVADWNLVFIPYCTGDVHTGNAAATYADPDMQDPDLEYQHAGHNNMMAVTDWLDWRFPEIPEMFLTGCSAGGAGSLVNYYFLRSQLNVTGRGYLLNDSGPIFPSELHSGPLHSKIRESWSLDSILMLLPEFAELQDDFGTINTLIADEFPEDRLAITYFIRDYNYSRYSYENFYDNLSKDDVHALWWDDTQLLMDLYDGRDNLAYYLPYYRFFNDSHCSTLITYLGSEIPESDMTMGGFVDELFSDEPLMSYLGGP